jgi:hypothetical protein
MVKAKAEAQKVARPLTSRDVLLSRAASVRGFC